METIKETFSIIAELIDIIGVLILLFGFLKALLNYGRAEFSKDLLSIPVRNLQEIRCGIGIYILLSLDFLIASDLIHTIMEISQQQLIELGVIVILRTGIGYFLGKEVEELHPNH